MFTSIVLVLFLTGSITALPVRKTKRQVDIVPDLLKIIQIVTAPQKRQETHLCEFLGGQYCVPDNLCDILGGKYCGRNVDLWERELPEYLIQLFGSEEAYWNWITTLGKRSLRAALKRDVEDIVLDPSLGDVTPVSLPWPFLISKKSLQ